MAFYIYNNDINISKWPNMTSVVFCRHNVSFVTENSVACCFEVRLAVAQELLSFSLFNLSQMFIEGGKDTNLHVS